MAENNSKSVDVDPHSNTYTHATGTCLPVAAVRAGECRSAVAVGLGVFEIEGQAHGQTMI